MGSRLKKILLSTAVIVGFTGYALRGRLTLGSDDVPVTAPENTNTGTTTTPPTNSSTIDQPTNTNAGSGSTNSSTTTGQYKDGTYTGPVTDAFYGNIQAVVTVKNGQITNVSVPVYPNDRENSVRINTFAIPYLKQEVIQAQSATINGVSGATASSEAFAQSVASALQQAQ